MVIGNQEKEEEQRGKSKQNIAQCQPKIFENERVEGRKMVEKGSLPKGERKGTLDHLLEDVLEERK